MAGEYHNVRTLTVPEGLAHNGGLHDGFQHRRSSNFVLEVVDIFDATNRKLHAAPMAAMTKASAMSREISHAAKIVVALFTHCCGVATQQRQFTSFRDRQMMHYGIGILFLSGPQSLMLRFDSGEAFARAAL